MMTSRLVYGGLCALAIHRNGSTARALSSTPPIVYKAEEAARAAEAEAQALTLLAERVEKVTEQSVNRKMTSASGAIAAAEQELDRFKQNGDSLLVRVGIAAAALGVTAGVFMRKGSDAEEGDGTGMETMIATWISSSSSSLAIACLATTSVALATLWRDRNGNDIISSCRHSLFNLFWFGSKEDENRNSRNQEIEQSYQQILQLDAHAKETTSKYKADQKNGLDPDTKCVLRSYETRTREARKDIEEAVKQVQNFRVEETAIDVEKGAHQVRHKAARLRQRDAEGPLWDFLVGVTAVLCSGGSTLAATVAWAASIPFASMLLRVVRHDSKAAFTELDMRRRKLADILRDVQEDPITTEKN